MNEEEVLARYRALKRWVDRERRRLGRTRQPMTQQFLRRSRLVDSIDPASLRELLRELREIPLIAFVLIPTCVAAVTPRSPG